MFVNSNLLNYDIQNTVLSVHTRPLQMTNPGTEQNFIRQNTQPGSLEVHTTDAEIEVDTTPCRESMGYGQLSDLSFVKERARVGKEKCSELIRRSVHEGEAMVEDRTTQKELAHQRFMEENLPGETVLKFYPGVPPEVTVEPGTTDIQYSPTEVNIDWENTGVVGYHFEQGAVNIDVAQRAYINFTYMGDPITFPDPDFFSEA